MPRKTKGMRFELHPRPTVGEDGKPLLYARPAKDNKKTMQEVDDFCAQNRGLRRGEMTRMFNCFMDVCCEWLAEGCRIETPLGVFAPKLRLLGDHTEPRRVSARDVRFAGIDFTPTKRFVNEVALDIKGLRKESGPVGNSQLQDTTFMRRALKRSMANGFTTIRQFCECTGLKYHSAKNYLDELCEGDSPQLRRERIGATYHYFPATVTKPRK